MIYVPGYGSSSAKLMRIGEAPGAHEEQLGRPFVGPTGELVNEMTRKAGIDPGECYDTNVVKIRPPNNEIHRLKELNVDIDYFLPQLWAEIDAIKPNCILALGGTALKALTGYNGIQKYRGSILQNTHSGLPKVVPTIHPAALLHGAKEMSSWRDKAFIQLDINRAVKQSEFRELRLPERNLHVAHNSLDVIRFIERYNGRRVLSVDIETFKTVPLCVGLAFSKQEAISIPLFNILSPTNESGIARHDVQFIWELVAKVLHDESIKIVGQNYKFDQKRLESIGIESKLWFDTGMAFHCLYSELPKKLQFQTSVLTEEPYYKDEYSEYNPNKDKLDKLLLYNAKDAAVTYEIYEREYAELENCGLTDFFFDDVMPLHDFYCDLEDAGIAIDPEARRVLRAKYNKLDEENDKELLNLLGHELNVNSPKQVALLLFGELKCPIRKDTGEETLEALMLNAVKDERRKSIIQRILKGRKIKKTISTYIEAKPHPDWRIRTTYNINGTESGRTSTSKRKAPIEVEPLGVAFQTLTKHGEVGSDLRSMYVPSPGKIFLEFDGAQAEARVVALLARDQNLIDEFNRTQFVRNKYGIKDDAHTKLAIIVTGIGFEEITDEIRQLGKKTGHAGNYGMKKGRFSMLAQISEWRAGKLLDKFHAEKPNIRNIFWRDIEEALARDGQVLTSPHGRRFQMFDRWGDELFKEAYSRIPQATISDHTKFVCVRVKRRIPWITFLQESHDSALVEIYPDQLQEAAAIIKEEYERPIDFSRCSLPRGNLIIPCEFKVGVTNWEKMEELKDGLMKLSEPPKMLNLPSASFTGVP